MRNRLMAIRLIVSAFLIVLITTSCRETELNPLEDEKGVYSIYGALDMDRNPNYIRVKDLRIPLSADSAKLNATVEFKDIEREEATILRDTIIQFSGNYTHNFILNKDLDPRKLYQLTVTRPDGNSVSSIATTPGATRHSVEPISVGECVSPLNITFENVLPSEQIRLEVGFEYEGFYKQEVSRYCDFEREGNQLSLNISTKNLLAMVFPAPGTGQLTCKTIEPAIHCDDLESDKVQLRYLHLGPEWQKVFPFYPNDPEDIQDVENGLGFFGGYRQDTLSYQINID